jgi:phenylpyruvate tautomerase PptA (4-oxalocrotonate tautomerase family)
MPQFFIEAPFGVLPEAKQTLMREITAAIDEAYGIPDVRVWLREYTADNVSQDGRTQAEPIRPVCFLEAPELHSVDVRRTMSHKIHAAVHKAYDGLANTEETLILMNFYPLESAGFAGRMQSENPQIVAAVTQLNA